MKETNLDEVKKIARMFLFLPYEESEAGKLFLIHPFYETAYQGMMTENGMQIFDITENKTAFEKVQDIYLGRIAEAESVDILFSIMRTSYWLTFIKYAEPYLSKQDFSTMLGEVWTMEENPNGDVNVKPRNSAAMFKRANKKFLMNDEEYAVYSKLPSEFVVYRGVAQGRVEKGLSWTRKLSEAKWFSNRFNTPNKKGYVLKGTIKKDKVLAYFNRRDENEIVCRYEDVNGIERLENKGSITSHG